MLVMVVHAIPGKPVHVVELQERIARNLLSQGSAAAFGIVVPRADDCRSRQTVRKPFQRGEHLLGIAAAQITAAATEYKQGISGNELVTDLVTGGSRRMPRRVQGTDNGLTQADFITTVMQGRQSRRLPPELRLGFHQVYLRIVARQDRSDAIDMIMVTVGQQDVGNFHPVPACQRLYLGNIPGRIYHRRTTGPLIVDQVDEILHGPQLQRMNGKTWRFCHHATLAEQDRGIHYRRSRPAKTGHVHPALAHFPHASSTIVVTAYGAGMTAHKLLLHPKSADFYVPRTRLATNLLELGLVDPPVPLAGSEFYPTGGDFLQLVTFLGCAPAIELDPPADPQTLASASASGQFCHVFLECAEQARLRADPRTPAPRCVQCKAPLADWPALLSKAIRQPGSTGWSCRGCGASGNLEQLQFRKTAAVARCWVEIRGIYPSEAVPGDALLQCLHDLGGGDWQAIYLQE